MTTTQPVGKVYVSGYGLSDIRILDSETLDGVDRIPSETNRNFRLVISDYLEEEEMNLVAFSEYDSSTRQFHVCIHNSLTNERLSQIVNVPGFDGLEILSSLSSSSTPIIVSARSSRLCAYNSLTTEKLIDCQNLPFNYINRIKCFPEWNLNEVFIGGNKSPNGLLHRYDLNQDCVLLGSYVGHVGSRYSWVHAITASLTEGILISGSYEYPKGTFKLWDKDTFECIESVDLDNRCYSLDYSSDSHLVCCGTFQEIEIFDIRNMRNRLRKILNVGNGRVNDLDSISNSPLFVSGDSKGFVSIWNSLTGRVLRKTKVGGSIRGIRFLPPLNTQRIEIRRIEQQEEDILGRQPQEEEQRAAEEEGEQRVEASSRRKLVNGSATVPSNVSLIRNAIQQVCLAGFVNEPEKLDVLDLILRNEKMVSRFMLRIQHENKPKYRALYACFVSSLRQFVKLHGRGPKTITPSSVDAVLRFDSGRKRFLRLRVKEFGVTVDAVVIEFRGRRRRGRALRFAPQQAEEERMIAERLQVERPRRQELLEGRERIQSEEEQRAEREREATQQLHEAQRQVTLEREKRERIQREAEEERQVAQEELRQQRERMRINVERRTTETRLALERAEAETNRLAQENALLQQRRMSNELSTDDITIDEDSILGQGGFTIVKAASLSIGAADIDVAVKISIRIMTEMNATQKQEMEDEVKKMVEAKHQFVVKCFGWFMDEMNRFCIVLELCSDGDLRHWIHTNKGRISMEKKLEILSEIAEAMEYLHSLGFLHRDLKPENVLLHYGHVKLSDFGLMRRLTSFTARSVSGTVEYLPNPIHRGDPKKIDVYAFGMILWETISELRAFEEERRELAGGNPHALLALILSQQLRPDVNQCPIDTPEEIRDLMVGCWDEMPENRPSFEEIVQDLTRIRRGGGRGEVGNDDEFGDMFDGEEEDGGTTTVIMTMPEATQRHLHLPSSSRAITQLALYDDDDETYEEALVQFLTNSRMLRYREALSAIGLNHLSDLEVLLEFEDMLEDAIPNPLHRRLFVREAKVVVEGRM